MALSVLMVKLGSKRQLWYNQTNAVYLLVPSIETNPSSEPSSPIPGKMCTSFL